MVTGLKDPGLYISTFNRISHSDYIIDFVFLNMKDMSQRNFGKNKINYSQTSSLDGANGGNGEGEPGAAPSSLGFPGALFGAPSENNSLFNY